MARQKEMPQGRGGLKEASVLPQNAAVPFMSAYCRKGARVCRILAVATYY